jgi:hypothetical protein
MEEFKVMDRVHTVGGHQWAFRFPNGYGASVVTGELFYTTDTEPYELGMVKFESAEGDDVCRWNLVYPEGLMEDVVGYLTEREVIEWLQKIKDYTPPEVNNEQ